MNEKEDITLDDLGAGLMCGLVVRAAPLTGWLFRAPYAHMAVEKVYQHLLEQPELNLRFAIYLDSIYRKSTDWDGQVDRLMLHAWLSQSIPEGTFTVHVSRLELSVWLLQENARLPGDRRLWLECTDMFIRTYSELQARAY